MHIGKKNARCSVSKEPNLAWLKGADGSLMPDRCRCYAIRPPSSSLLDSCFIGAVWNVLVFGVKCLVIVVIWHALAVRVIGNAQRARQASAEATNRDPRYAG